MSDGARNEPEPAIVFTTFQKQPWRHKNYIQSVKRKTSQK